MDKFLMETKLKELYPNETWINCFGSNEYWITPSGRIFSFSRKNRSGKELKLTKNNSGYFTVYIHKKTMVHREVWKAFNKKEIEKGMTVNHINGIKDDNRIENLNLLSVKENIIHSLKTGLTKRKHNGEFLLTKEEAQTIKFFHVHKKGQGATVSLLGKIFGVDRHTVNNIASGKTSRYFFE